MYLDKNEIRAKKLELYDSINKNTEVPNVFSSLIVMRDIVKELQAEVKKRVVDPAVNPDASFFGSNGNEMKLFRDVTTKLVDQSDHLIREFEAVLQGKMTKTQFSSNHFLYPAEVKAEKDVIVKNESLKSQVPKLDHSDLPTVDMMKKYADIIKRVVNFVLASAEEAITTAEMPATKALVPNVTTNEFDDFGDIGPPSSTGTPMVKRQEMKKAATKDSVAAVDKKILETKDGIGKVHEVSMHTELEDSHKASKEDTSKKEDKKKNEEEGKKDKGKKEEGKKEEGKKEEGKKEESKKEESKKEESKKEESKKEESKKEDRKKEEGTKEVAKKEVAKKGETKKEEGTKEVAKKEEAKKEEGTKEVAKKDVAKEEVAKKEVDKKSEKNKLKKDKAKPIATPGAVPSDVVDSFSEFGEEMGEVPTTTVL
jgi:hypothetical protein